MNLQEYLSEKGLLKPDTFAAELECVKLTPFDAYRAVTAGIQCADSVLLDSASPNPETGRYSIIGVSPTFTFRASGKDIEIAHGDEKLTYSADPFAELEKILAARKRPAAGPYPFIGGAAGFFSYDINRFFECLPDRTRAKEPSGCPDIHLLFIDDFFIFDHLKGSVRVVSNYDAASPGSAAVSREKVEKISALLNSRGGGIRSHSPVRRGRAVSSAPRSRVGKPRFMEMVAKAKEYIKAGDIYQANLSHRIDADSDADALALYENLRMLNPSPFASFMRAGGMEIISCSPERLIKKDGAFVETRPIAGTRPRGKDRREDFVMRSDLLLNEKERAEHIMLVDLERNDLGRVCLTGSVEVDEFMAVEQYSHVQHIVSNVRGILKDGVGFTAMLKAVFPGGTITGVPKIRCMEIIDELEPTRRGLYTGAIGYISDCGNCDLNIVIRTIVKNGTRLSVQVGAGIVADSDPEREYEETMHKARAMIEAIAASEDENYKTVPKIKDI